jgi:hypothetical protein
MRVKDKIYCDSCGKFLRKLTKIQMIKINEDKKKGTRTNCSYFCEDC